MSVGAFNTYRDVWLATHASVCFIKFFDPEKGVRLSSGSGFKVGSYLITNNHVLQVPSATGVLVQFVAQDGRTLVINKFFTMAEFRNRLLDGDSEVGWDYAIIDLDVPEFQHIPSLHLAEQDDQVIGTPIALLGFQLDQFNLSMHTGIIASKPEKQVVNGTVRYLQIDASVNQGNSGGPLIQVETGEVIGIITRKATGLTTYFEYLRTGLNDTLASHDAFGSIRFNNADFVLGQLQLRGLIDEIERSANVGIGYAYELEKVRHSLSLLD